MYIYAIMSGNEALLAVLLVLLGGLLAAAGWMACDMAADDPEDPVPSIIITDQLTNGQFVNIRTADGSEIDCGAKLLVKDFTGKTIYDGYWSPHRVALGGHLSSAAADAVPTGYYSLDLDRACMYVRSMMVWLDGVRVC